MLAEIAEVGHWNKKAWGTFITNFDPARELAIQIPHPLNYLDTPEQGISVFKATRARSLKSSIQAGSWSYPEGRWPALLMPLPTPRDVS